MKKLSLKNVKSTLSRNEMRVIAGGYGYGGKACVRCSSAYDCESGLIYAVVIPVKRMHSF